MAIILMVVAMEEYRKIPSLEHYVLVYRAKAMEEEAYIFGCHKDDIDPYHKVTLMSTELDNSNDDNIYNVLKWTRP